MVMVKTAQTATKVTQTTRLRAGRAAPASEGGARKPTPHHPARQHIYVPTDLGARAADVITNFVGSWLFVGLHALWFIVWIILRFEPFPFGLLTLLVSLEAIFLSTFVMMSQNRAAQKDHLRDDHEAEEVEMLYQINQQQLEILALLRTHMCPDAPLSEATAQTCETYATRALASGASARRPANTTARPAEQRAGKASAASAPVRRRR